MLVDLVVEIWLPMALIFSVTNEMKLLAKREV